MATEAHEAGAKGPGRSLFAAIPRGWPRTRGRHSRFREALGGWILFAETPRSGVCIEERLSLASLVHPIRPMRKSTPVRDYMSRLPQEVEHHEPLSVAVQLMSEHHIRHIPVMDGVRLLGVLSRQDVQDAWLRFGGTAGEKKVADVCTRDVLSVDPLSTIPEVAGAMVTRGITSALVTDAGVLVGIFTSTDALRVLSEL